MFRRHERATTGRHRRAGAVVTRPDPSTPTPPDVVDTARARLDPVTSPLPLPVPVTVPGSRLRPPERRLIRTG